MQINVTVDGLDGVDLTTVIGDEIAYYDEETGATEHRPRTLGDLVAEKLTEKLIADLGYDGRTEIIREVRAERSKVIQARVEPIITEAITGPIRLTNSYGEPTGPETTLNALIVEEAKKAIGGNRNDYGRGETLAQRVIKDAVSTALTRELADVVKAEKDKVIAAVRAKAADLIADAVKQGVGR